MFHFFILKAKGSLISSYDKIDLTHKIIFSTSTATPSNSVQIIPRCDLLNCNHALHDVWSVIVCPVVGSDGRAAC